MANTIPGVMNEREMDLLAKEGQTLIPPQTVFHYSCLEFSNVIVCFLISLLFYSGPMG